MNNFIHYVECPRDAWQGLQTMIPSENKRAHLQALLEAGFRQLDLASFVSPKAVPQMADSETVLASLARPEQTEFIGIVANMRGLERALLCEPITHYGYPLSVNERFQQANSGKDIAASWQLLAAMQARIAEENAQGQAKGDVLVYLSMGFGNPYDEPWQPHNTATFVQRLRAMGIERIALADTVGSATPETIIAVLDALELPSFHNIGLHLHARPDAWQALLEPALERGIRWFEGALAGQGGCPFAADALVGNLPSEQVLPWLEQQGYQTGIRLEHLPQLSQQARALAQQG